MNFDEMNDAVNDARRTIRFADINTRNMVKMIKGRLRTLDDTWQSHNLLIALKKELNQYNATTRTWKN